MANVLLSYFAELGEPLYDALSEVLLKNGNNVFRINTNNSSVDVTEWGGNSKLIDDKVLDNIKEFDPDIIINFNNSLPTNVSNNLDSCVNCIIDADNISYFWNKKNLLNRKERLLYLGLQSDSKTIYENYLNMEMTDDNYLYFPPATTIKKTDEEQDKNITFIGTNFYPVYPPQIRSYYTETGLEVYRKLKEDYYYDVERLKKESKSEVTDELIRVIKDSIAGQERLKYLQSLTDLGLVIYGVRWDLAAYYDYELYNCYDDRVISTAADNEWVYNTSKVSVNISHPQATSSFSWRVMDIMASNACLVTEMKRDWNDLFGNYISDEVKDAIIYTDRYELRDKVKTILEDESLRNKCVSELNKSIEENGRWESRFAKLEKQTGIRLLNNNTDSSQYIYIKRSEKKKQVVEEELPAPYEIKGPFVTRLVRNGVYKVSHVPKIRHYLWDIIRQ